MKRGLKFGIVVDFFFQLAGKKIFSIFSPLC